MTRAGTMTAEDEALRQTRLSKFGRVLALIGAAFVGIHCIFSIWLHEPIFDLEVVPEAVATVAFVALWVLLRSEKRSARFVRACELTTLLIGSGGFAAMAIT